MKYSSYFCLMAAICIAKSLKAQLVNSTRLLLNETNGINATESHEATATQPPASPLKATPTITRQIYRCQSKSGEFLPSATDCEDHLSTGPCSESFPPNKNANTSHTRPGLCENPALYEEALDCAKTCKLCCERKANLSEVQSLPRIIEESGENEGRTPPTPLDDVINDDSGKSEQKLETSAGKEKETLRGDHRKGATKLPTTGNFPGIIADPAELDELQSATSTTCKDDKLFIMECKYLKGQCTSDETWIISLIRLCPETCGICENLNHSRRQLLSAAATVTKNGSRGTVETRCEDKHLRCADLKKEFCEDVENGALFVRRCPQSCGKCVAKAPAATEIEDEIDKIAKIEELKEANGGRNGCSDAASDCEVNAQECENVLYKSLMKKLCKKTCKFCASESIKPAKKTAIASTAAPTVSTVCEDNSRNCIQWNIRGFCTSQFYKEITKLEWCKKTCRLC